MDDKSLTIRRERSRYFPVNLYRSLVITNITQMLLACVTMLREREREERKGGREKENIFGDGSRAIISIDIHQALFRRPKMCQE